LTEFRNFFGADRRAYISAKNNSEYITFKRGDFWSVQINQMFELHQSTFNITNRLVNEFFFQYLTRKQKISPSTERHIITEFHQILHLAIAAARNLVSQKAKADIDNKDLRILLNTIDGHDFFNRSNIDATKCAVTFKHNIGLHEEINFSQLASRLVAELFVEIVMDLDIRGFLMNPQNFMEGHNNNKAVWGFVYVFIAPTHAVQSHPMLLMHKNIIKIGETRRFPEKRAQELSAGLLNENWTVHDAVLTKARLRLEEIVHAELSHKRVAKNEFFDLSPYEAIKLIRQRRRNRHQQIFKKGG